MSHNPKPSRRESRFLHRAMTGPGKWLALRELDAAARLWQEYASKNDGLVVDFGAGNGKFWDIVHPPDNLILLDISASLMQSCRTPCAKIVANAIDPPLADGSCAGIVALGLIEYIPDLLVLFQRWRALAGENCLLLVSNSPPILPNLARQWFGFGAIARANDVVANSLRNSGWDLLIANPVRVGWQSLFVAK